MRCGGVGARAATRERVITVAASLVDGRLLAELMLPAVALSPGEHATGKCELRVVGDNDAGFARSIANMLPTAVRGCVCVSQRPLKSVGPVPVPAPPGAWVCAWGGWGGT
jgi:hypothetical protein